MHTAVRRIIQVKKKISNIIWIVAFLGGLSLLLYPSVSNYWNSLYQSRAIAVYDSNLAKMTAADYEAEWEKAYEFQENLSNASNYKAYVDAHEDEYNAVLNVGGDGIMGYVEIPKINVRLPIYHGTDDTVLQVAIGHLEWTSLPIGEVGTHAVFSGHRGLPSAKLLTDMDKLSEGDYFVITVLDRTYTYEIDQILIVLPEETDELMPVEGKEYVTLITCTPYGINSHRMLVRGHRIDNIEGYTSASVHADALQIDGRLVMPFIAIVILILYALIMAIYRRFIKRKEKKK